jgi:hypothetical protein
MLKQGNLVTLTKRLFNGGNIVVHDQLGVYANYTKYYEIEQGYWG